MHSRKDFLPYQFDMLQNFFSGHLWIEQTQGDLGKPQLAVTGDLFYAFIRAPNNKSIIHQAFQVSRYLAGQLFICALKSVLVVNSVFGLKAAPGPL